ncbi:MAG: aconitase family protein [Candidatus Tectomicrobia bacterium]|nr:aconitase family protein [Candidatus Tectomicrobia bacterium]
MAKPQTLFDKIWQSHLVEAQDDGINILYIDRHLLHEVLSPQAFEGLRMSGRKVRRPDTASSWPRHNSRRELLLPSMKNRTPRHPESL